VSRIKWSPHVRVIRVMCSGRMDPTFVVNAFRQGADGVIISGCHPGDCHYNQGNYKALRRVHLLKRLLAGLRHQPGASQADVGLRVRGGRWAEVTNEMTQTIRSLGPLRLES
jgi:F420-non-reducing hydrogenase iron-sulfur subunit